MVALLNEVIRYKARRLAEVHIKGAVHDLTQGQQFNFESCKRQMNNYWKRKSVNLVFENAYDSPWYALGSEDALKGWRRFDVPAYQKGWRSQILAFAFVGWINPRIIQQYGWIDKAIGQQFINIKHDIDQLDWEAARYNDE
ncbi:hypothetical protein [Pseudomonas sp. NPDC087817]|uniref:hypothetical protein n=1 Tax=Pseudomonas sp. NPDC087817 TaxID=3364451 RepID=UPI00381DADAE